ncbi:hypothetical protein MCUN1_003636 [Malassezia cuniculi]|uniref:Uncharacterized protein n=1 Tax=Malassezia cuniculi TaxID=948313 RepID=A0AAF0J8E5_9BASI|nr:hypothetical protein MCUN1_003636 [Malassezia cuniculi]
MSVAKRTVSAADVYGTENAPRGLTRTCSEYASIPDDVHSRLQSMSWRIRSNVSRGYIGTVNGAAAPHHEETPRWGRATTIATSGAQDVSSASLKRTADNDDSDAILANCFEDDDAWGGPTVPMQTISNERPVRSLPARGLRPTMSMPPLHDISPAFDAAQNCPDTEMQDDAFRMVDFSAFASRTDGF